VLFRSVSVQCVFDDGHVLVEDTLYRNYIATQEDRIKGELSESTEKLEEIQRGITEKERKFEEAQKEAQDAWKEVQQLNSEAVAAQEDKEAAQERAAEAQEKFEELNREFNQKKAAMQRELQAARQDIEDKLSAYEKDAEEREAQLMNDVLKLQNYVAQRADQLHRLDLISDNQRDALAETPSPGMAPEDALSFSADLNNDYQRLIDHVQAFLLDNEILYPRFLLEDFLTLLRTHDLIILSGLSGSGKTQLIHSFADALCGKAHVIPVKPNWTSSEDLLGYYNPLQKSYLSTPFLDALIEARRDTERLHLICLDEMNLARVEYYFADFLSRLEERKATPKLPLYSTEEAGHVEAEFRMIMEVIDEAEHRETGKTYDSFGELLRDEEISSVLQKRLGIKSGKSFVELHARLRRILAGVLNVPAALELPENVRFIGAVNMDQTTNALAPKVLDRAHVIRFESPMTYDWSQIRSEADSTGADPRPVQLPASEFTPPRQPYTAYAPTRDKLANTLRRWTDDYLRPIGIDIGLRTVRQAANYRDLLEDVHQGTDVYSRALNNVTLKKILPRFSFEGRRSVNDSTNEQADTRHERVQKFHKVVQQELDSLDPDAPYPHAARELRRLIQSASQSSATIYNYWA